jgi:hypothetical protein
MIALRHACTAVQLLEKRLLCKVIFFFSFGAPR